MTNSLFFDNDCLSAFLWVGNQNLVAKLYPGRVVIPKHVYDELKIVGHLRASVDALLADGSASLGEITVGSEEYSLYHELTQSTDYRKRIGKGEAAAISMAKSQNGILASNNLKDVARYVEDFQLKHVTTGDILIESLNQNLITMSEGEDLWAKMIKKKRKLGANTFSEFIESKEKALAIR